MRLIGLAFCQLVAIIEPASRVRWFLMIGLLVCYRPLANFVAELVADRDSEDSPSSPNGALIKIPAVITGSKLVYEPEAGHWARLNQLC